MTRTEEWDEVKAPLPREGQGAGASYQETIDYLFNAAPLFQNIGTGAYKEGLSNTHVLDAHFGHPHSFYRTIHVGGTNGKGSVSHTLAAILQSAGYRVGLYTSPHLVDFRERIRVNGEMIPEQRVIDFVEKERGFFEPLHPSFFELATALAFLYFKEQQVDIAVIEVGLGGRLDCTNIITPILSIITNISFDHTQFLGDTLEKIACEKAGIIKSGIPVVIGETNGHEEVRKIFFAKAQEMDAPITFADEQPPYPLDVVPELKGFCQKKNTQTILAALQQLTMHKAQGTIDNSQFTIHNAQLKITPTAIQQGFAHVCELTGLMGRWQKLQDHPTVVCDTGHNPGGLQYIAEQLKTIHNAQFIMHNKPFGKDGNVNNAQQNNSQFSISNFQFSIRIVLGMVGDKDVRTSLSLFPTDAVYYFTQASVKRAMPAEEIAALGKEFGLLPPTHRQSKEDFYPTVAEAYRAALEDALPDDFIFVGGSSFVVADLLTYLLK